MEKSILYPDPYLDQSKNLTDSIWLKVYHATKFGSNLSTVKTVFLVCSLFCENNGSQLFEILCYFECILTSASKNAKIKGAKIAGFTA